LALTFSAAVVAQEVVRIPLNTEAEEDVATAPAEPATGNASDSAPDIGSDISLSDEELMDQFLQPLSERPVFDAEVDGAENLPAPIPDEAGISRIAVVRGLDKITARVRDVEAPVGVPVMFNSFEILVQTCDKRPPEETPETTAFLQVTEHRIDGTLERIFSGWMYASSPSLNPVEHSTYDVWLIDCRTL
jgi:hypothetical protein